MNWLGISGIVLLIAGALVPALGPILHRSFAGASFALCAAGILMYSAAVSRRGSRGTQDGSGDPTGGISDTTSDHGSGHGWHDGGHSDDGAGGGH